MKSSRKGMMPTELLVVVGILGIVSVVMFNIGKRYIFGNQQFIDLKYHFNVAYVRGDDGKYERMKIKAWKDWKDSDAIQIVKEDGTAIYTHLQNVKLTKEN